MIMRGSWIIRTLMLVIAVFAVPSLRLTAMQCPPCARPDGSSMHQEMSHGSGHRMAGPAPALWDDDSTHECPHCPASQCARIAPCASSSNAAAVMTPFVVTHTASDQAMPARVPRQLFSTSHQPPTPPPQLISQG